MKQSHQKITPLSIDIRAAVKNFDASVEMTRLCNDVSDPILLTDEKPVMNISQDEFVGIFDLRHNHHFLTPDEVFRIAIYCRLELPCIGDPDELRRGEILDHGLNASSPWGLAYWFVVQRKDGCFSLSYTTIPRDEASERFGQALIDGEFAGASHIPLVIEDDLDGSP